MFLIYKCPSCGGNMKMRVKTAELYCEHCENKVSLFDYTSCEMELQEDQRQKENWQTATRSFGCPMCGAHMAALKESITCMCSFCGTDMILEEQIEGELTPDKIIPFNVEKKTAAGIIQSYINTRIGEVHQVEKKDVQGIYVPFWLYDFGGDAVIRGTGRLDRRRYNIVREGKIILEKVPLDASIKMNNALMDNILPYEYCSLYDFQKGALAGFMAERYDYRYDDMQERLRKKIEHFTETTLRDKMEEKMRDPNGMRAQKYHQYAFPKDYEAINVEQYKSRTYLLGIHYALLPVWHYTFVHEGRRYQVAVNGQTGKSAGNFTATAGRKAVSFGRRWIAAVSGVLGLGVLAVMGFMKGHNAKGDNVYLGKDALWSTLWLGVAFLAVTVGSLVWQGFMAAVCQSWQKKKTKEKEREFAQTGQYLAWDGFELTKAQDIPQDR